jgi:hypothetical protein
MLGVHNAIKLTAFPSLFCGLTLRYPYHKTINYKAAIYGGVKQFNLNVEKEDYHGKTSIY